MATRFSPDDPALAIDPDDPALATDPDDPALATAPDVLAPVIDPDDPAAAIGCLRFDLTDLAGASVIVPVDPTLVTAPEDRESVIDPDDPASEIGPADLAVAIGCLRFVLTDLDDLESETDPTGGIAPTGRIVPDVPATDGGDPATGRLSAGIGSTLTTT